MMDNAVFSGPNGAASFRCGPFHRSSPMIPTIRSPLSWVFVAIVAFHFSPACAQSVPEAATQVGITPEALVVADISTQDAQSILAHLESAATERAALGAHHAACDAAILELIEL